MTYNDKVIIGLQKVAIFAISARRKVRPAIRASADSYITMQNDPAECLKRLVNVYALYDHKQLVGVPGIAEKGAKEILAAREAVRVEQAAKDG